MSFNILEFLGLDGSSQLTLLIIQGIGFLGFSFYTLSYQFLKPRHTILMQTPADLLNSIHFLGLGSPMSAYIAFSAFFRDMSNGLGSNKIGNIVSVLFLISLAIGTYFFAQSWYEYCAVVGSTMMTFAQYFRDDFYLYRFLCVSHNILWLVLFFMIASIPGMIFMSCILISNLIGIVRYTLKRQTPVEN